MKRKVGLLLAVWCLALPQTCLADEMSDAEAAVAEAESMLDMLNSMGSWFGPALIMKTEVENYLEMAKEAFEAGEYADALHYAEMALMQAKKAVGMRAWLLLTRQRCLGGLTTSTPK